MSILFSMTRDINGFNGFGLIPSDDIYGGKVAQNTAYTVTVPSNYENWIALISYTPGSEFWVAYNVAATVPAIGVASMTTELNPAGRQLKAGDTLSFISNNTGNPGFSVSFYALVP